MVNIVKLKKEKFDEKFSERGDPTFSGYIKAFTDGNIIFAREDANKSDILHEEGHIKHRGLSDEKRRDWHIFWLENKNRLSDVSGAKRIVRLDPNEAFAETYSKCKLGKSRDSNMCKRFFR